jgi:hypothetical protein
MFVCVELTLSASNYTYGLRAYGFVGSFTVNETVERRLLTARPHGAASPS